ncbi:hypothetical protein FB45DRAFT_931357 [Roridomyces roridus]|uniref:Uncharacterized protein n=1 Tax=Roridomyces roridus TaxID=1738132 RepID=A0AAD7FET8_9AGAR|nr:hypothetical protein FB45DRAFT_931357 [Roridomyces roridus]
MAADNWTPHRHPEGALYFVHKGPWRIFTDAYLYDDKILKKVDACVQHVHARLSTKDSELDADEVDIVLLEPDEDHDSEKPLTCGYYLVDHLSRTIFWMDEFELSKISTCQRVGGVLSESHIESILEHEYWRHCDVFPSALRLTSELIEELCDILVFSATDALTSPGTTIPFSADDLHKMLALTAHMRHAGQGSRTTTSGVKVARGSATSLARVMMLFANERVNHFHGEYAARIDRSLSVYPAGSPPQGGSGMAIISPLLFNAPKGHLRDLRGLFMDRIISQVSWKRYIEKVLTEWQEMTLYASLILNANVGILAIPGNQNTSIAQMSSFVSVCFALGSIIMGLFLSRKYRPETVDAVTAGPASSFKEQCLGAFEAYAILFSLPYVFMMWSMIFFLTTFLIMAVEIGNLPTRATILTTASALLLAVAFAVFGAYGTTPRWSFWALKRRRPPASTTGKPDRESERKTKVDLRQASRRFFRLKRGPPEQSPASDV